jgi:hypothetical protein
MVLALKSGVIEWFQSHLVIGTIVRLKCRVECVGKIYIQNYFISSCSIDYMFISHLVYKMFIDFCYLNVLV